jgi:hypothetical protein
VSKTKIIYERYVGDLKASVCSVTDVLCHHLPGRDEENLRIFGVPTKIRTKQLRNTK